jgi:prepilin-type N-terminal cleavage/methylation domain-containing protein
MEHIMWCDKQLQSDETNIYNREFSLNSCMLSNKGFTLIEIFVSMAIFAIIVTAVYEAFISQMKHSAREYKIAESEMELGIAKNIIGRDLAMAGFGLADDYSAVSGFNIPRPVRFRAAPYTLILTGTALGLRSRAAQGWTYMSSVDVGNVPSFHTWNDAREDVRTDPGGIVNRNDAVIIMEPSTKKLLAQGAEWLFRYNGSTNANLTTLSGNADYTNSTIGTLVYGLHRADETPATQPYYAVSYYLDDGSNNPSVCAPNTFSLMRAESDTTDYTAGTPAGGNRILACVRDFQVAPCLDTDGDGAVDNWDPTAANGYDVQTLKKALKQIKMYILVQAGNRDNGYTYPDQSIRVGDISLGTGRIINLTDEQRRYRWRLVSLSVTPRNVR